jgi:hypothetical protein
MGFHSYQCTRKGKVKTEGEWYCKQHDPKAEKAKRDAKYAEWEAERGKSEKNLADTKALIKRFGYGGTPYYSFRFDSKLGGYGRAIVLSFAEIENIITALKAGQLMFEQVEEERA